MKKILTYSIANVLLAAVVAGINYFTLTTFNFTSGSTYWFAIIVGIAFTVVNGFISFTFADIEYTREEPDMSIGKRIAIAIPAIVVVVALLTAIVGGFASGSMFRDDDLFALADSKVEEKDFSEYEATEENVPVVNVIGNHSINDVSVSEEDLDTATYLAKRKLGTITEKVSQFNLGKGTPQYLNDKAVVVFPLEYADCFKWWYNHEIGVTNVIIVDISDGVNDKDRAQIVDLKGGMKYVPTACFGEDLYRHVYGEYYNVIKGDAVFELDDEMNPYYVIPMLKHTVGLFGGTDAYGVITVNAITGEMKDWSVKELPEWVDNVYSYQRLRDIYSYYATYREGWVNSWTTQKGVTQLTPSYSVKRGDGEDAPYTYYRGYNLIPVNGKLYIYSGETSVANDESNIGFVLMNIKTGEMIRYSVPGAEEYSAMQVVEDDKSVKSAKYHATFPLLVKIDGVPTYVLSLRDSSGLVKEYACVEVENSSNYVIASNYKEAVKKYKKTLNGEKVEITDINEVDENNLVPLKEKYPTTTVEGQITDIRTGMKNGDSYYYIKVAGQYYSVNLTDNETIILKNVGDTVTLEVAEGVTGEIIPADLD